MVAEGLPLVIRPLLPSGAIWTPFAISTTAVALFGEILPQAIMPLYIIEVGGRSMWFVKTVMWILAIPACLPAYGLRRFRQWKTGSELEKMEGLMDLIELAELVRLHEESRLHGGPLTDDTSAMVRTIMLCQHETIGENFRPWQSITMVDITASIRLSTLGLIKGSSDPYVVVRMRKETNQLHQDQGEGDEENSKEVALGGNVQLLGILHTKVCISENKI